MFLFVQQSYVEVFNRNLVNFGMGLGQGFEDFGVVSSCLQQLTELLQHGGSMF